MSIPISRRDLVLGLGGGMAGLALSPLPWKLVDDVALWSQHRRALPIPPGGEVTTRSSACTLCPGGCALRVRCVAGRPVATMGEPRHPRADGACALGLTIHQLALHPLRLRGAMRRQGDTEHLEPVSPDVVLAAVTSGIADARRQGQSVAVLDQRPGRALSFAYREWLATLPQGLYVTSAGEEATLRALSEMTDGAPRFALDLENTKTLLSFGAPVLDGWGRPGRILARRAHLRVLAVDTWHSPTAAMADEWVQVRPGTEGALAFGLVHVLLREGLGDPGALAHTVGLEAGCSNRALVESLTPARVAQITGVEASKVEALARAIAIGRPTVAVGGGDPARGPLRPEDEQAIAVLDVVLGSVGQSGGFLPRNEVPGPDVAQDAVSRGAEASRRSVGLERTSGKDGRRGRTPDTSTWGGASVRAEVLLASATDVAAVPDGTLRILLLDAADGGRALPWSLLERKLSPGALIVSLSPFRSGLARHAQLLLPAPAPLEAFDEVLPSVDDTEATFGLAAPVVSPPKGCLDPAEVVGRLAEATGASLVSGRSSVLLLKQRVKALCARGRGRVVARTDAGFEEVEVGTAETVWEQLAQGGRWIDERPGHITRLRVTVKLRAGVAAESPRTEPSDLALVPTGVRGVVGGTPVAPVLTKLYQESDLRTPVGLAALHPATAEALGLAEKDLAQIENGTRALVATIRLDRSLPLACVGMAAGPEPVALHPNPGVGSEGALVLCTPDDQGAWHQTRVRVRKA
jgi:anaerobic selenocysteine-containing dehydrogenase